jgi:ABC-2 type transport system ATP-binding protein
MGEVEQICDRAGVIRKGELVAEGTIEELRGAGGLLVRADPLERAAEVVGEIPGVDDTRIEQEYLRISTDPERSREVSRALFGAGIDLLELRPAQRSLEEVFFQLTADEARGEDVLRDESQNSQEEKTTSKKAAEEAQHDG